MNWYRWTDTGNTRFAENGNGSTGLPSIPTWPAGNSDGSTETERSQGTLRARAFQPLWLTTQYTT